MNNGAFGENFPYSNFHDLNTDWIVKIVKDFLDQYTNIQETIQTGLDDLDAKATELEGLLQEWYDTHSEDIANQLATALESLNEWYTEHENYLDQTLADNITAFDTHAEQKAQQTIESIPDDYTTLSQNVDGLLKSATESREDIIPLFPYVRNEYVDQTNGNFVSYNGWSRTGYIDLDSYEYLLAEGLTVCPYNAFYNSDKQFIIGFATTTTETRINIPTNAKYMAVSGETNKIDDITIKGILKFSEIENILTQYNSNILPWRDSADFTTTQRNGVTWSWNTEHTECSVTGTATNESFANLIISEPVPAWMKTGIALRFNSSNDGIFIRIYLTINNQNTSIDYYNGEHILTIPTEATRVVVVMRAYSGRTYNDEVTVEFLSAPSNAKLYENMTSGSIVKLHACTYNTGYLNYGKNYEQHTPTNVPERITAVKEFIGENDFDIICTQETPTEIPNNGVNINIDTEIFEPAFTEHYHGNFMLTISSKYTLSEKRSGYFTAMVGSNQRGWQMGYITVEGKRIAIFNCHLAYQDTAEGASVRALQIQEIIQMLSASDTAIIFGDFNTISDSEYNLFTNAGYTIMNGGYLPFEKTWDALNLQYAPDNIIIKGNGYGFRKRLDAQYVHGSEPASDRIISDHLPMSAHITIE